MGLLDGKVAIITGASKGIGRVMSQQFAREGARVVCANAREPSWRTPMFGLLRTLPALLLASALLGRGVDFAVAATDVAAVMAAAEQRQKDSVDLYRFVRVVKTLPPAGKIKLVESKRNDVELWSLRFGVNE